MDFGDILSEWERTKASPKPVSAENPAYEQNQDGKQLKKNKHLFQKKPKAHPVDIWLRKYGVVDKDKILDQENKKEPPAHKRRRLQLMKPEASIDLHGLSQEEAWTRLEAFVADSVKKKLEKIQIIHGKGLHSENDPVLKKLVRSFIEQNPHAGEFGLAEKTDGGSGATWVILKTSH